MSVPNPSQSWEEGQQYAEDGFLPDGTATPITPTELQARKDLLAGYASADDYPSPANEFKVKAVRFALLTNQVSSLTDPAFSTLYTGSPARPMSGKEIYAAVGGIGN